MTKLRDVTDGWARCPLNMHQFTLTQGDRTQKKVSLSLSQKKHHLAVFCIDHTTNLCSDYVRIWSSDVTNMYGYLEKNQVNGH